jgi:hypothetical protein
MTFTIYSAVLSRFNTPAESQIVVNWSRAI